MTAAQQVTHCEAPRVLLMMTNLVVADDRVVADVDDKIVADPVVDEEDLVADQQGAEDDCQTAVVLHERAELMPHVHFLKH